MRVKQHLRNAVLAFAVLIIPAAAHSAETADLIKYRQSVMKAIGGHMGAIAAIVKGKVDNSDHLKNHAAGLSAAGKSVRDVFQADSADGKTEVLPSVWEKPDEFSQAVTQFEQAADGFLQAADSGDPAQIGAALKELGGSCKGCHDDFRQKKK